MATRFCITGFEFAKMQTLTGIGAGTNGLDLSNAASKSEIAAVLTRAQNEGIPFPDLECESANHVEAAEILSHFGQTHVPTGIEGWKSSSLREFSKKVSKKASDEQKTLIDFLLDGRPIFGKAIDRQPQYYAYLRLSEIKLLRSCLQPWTEVPAQAAGPFDPEYMQRLLECGYEREVAAINHDCNVAEHDLTELDDLETALSRWFYEFESRSLDLWLLVT